MNFECSASVESSLAPVENSSPLLIENTLPALSDISEKVIANLEAKLGTKDAGSLLVAFLDAFKTTHEELQPKVKSRDSAAVKMLTHRLIGLCPTFDAEDLADLAREIEQCLKVDDWQTAEKYCQELGPKFKQFCTQLVGE